MSDWPVSGKKVNGKIGVSAGRGREAIQSMASRSFVRISSCVMIQSAFSSSYGVPRMRYVRD